MHSYGRRVTKTWNNMVLLWNLGFMCKITSIPCENCSFWSENLVFCRITGFFCKELCISCGNHKLYNFINRYIHIINIYSLMHCKLICTYINVAGFWHFCIQINTYSAQLHFFFWQQAIQLTRIPLCIQKQVHWTYLVHLLVNLDA